MDLSSTLFTVVGTLIVALIGYLSAMRVKGQDIRSENISKNRQEWRLKLRKIAVKDGFLNEEDYQQILGNINSYHAESNLRSFFMKDQHIKNAINNIEDNVAKSKIVKEYLRLLLKYDWDRSRCEIMGISKRKISDNYVSSVALYSASLSGKGQVFSRIFKGTNWSRKSIRNYALSLSTEEKKKKARHRNAIIYAILVILLFILAVVVTILAISSHFSYVGYYMTALLFAVPSIVLGTLVTYFTRANYKFNPNKPGIFQWQSVDDVFLMVVD
ncbi:hypothetical protein [Levilactobacillus namurensis]|uniref:Uncharacterized protein n=1 Tax=Levilactobacillus namurensis TaxID=380393 RepID=A0AAW8W5I0_9LACO|nr:hypothetical protein [Levilactobacillus namurensis]MDT7013669.1 hypothetical protein [Levilactobacillus namurensis]